MLIVGWYKLVSSNQVLLNKTWPTKMLNCFRQSLSLKALHSSPTCWVPTISVLTLAQIWIRRRRCEVLRRLWRVSRCTCPQSTACGEELKIPLLENVCKSLLLCSLRCTFVFLIFMKVYHMCGTWSWHTYEMHSVCPYENRVWQSGIRAEVDCRT